MAFINEVKHNNLYISSWTHINPIPEHLKQITSEEFELVLRLASESLLSLRESANSHNFQDVLNKKISNEVLKVKKECEEQIQTKQKLVDRLEIQKKEIQESYNLLQQNFLNLQSSVTQSIEKNISCGLEKQNIFFSGQVSSIQKTFEGRESIYKDQIKELKDLLDKYQKHSLIDQNSSNKGKQGETSFDGMVAQFTTWSLEDTSKAPDACDRQSIIRGCRTLFEIKNYSNRVPKSEVDKFKRNMEQHKDSPFGIFISLNTNIVGGPQELLYTEVTSNNQLLVYIQNFLSFDYDTIFCVLNNYIDMAQLLYTRIQNVSDDDDQLQSRIDSIKPILNNSFIQISLMLNEMNNHKKFMIDKVTQQHSSMKLHIDKMKLMFESILKTFFPEEKSIIVDEEEEIKKAVKRKKKSTTPVGSSNE